MKTFKQWLKDNKEYLNKAQSEPFPKKLRPATAKDIKKGKLIYYPEAEHCTPFWQIVDEVMRPSSDYKAYCAEDGCRYGLDGAFVERERKLRA